MRTELIDNWSGFASLGAEWNDLLSRSRADTIFLRWEWIQSWVEIARQWARPLVVSVRDGGGSLAGIAPFYISEFRLGGILPYRTLRVMADYATGSEYPDWITHQECEAEATRAIVKTLAAFREYWDCIWMPNVAGWTGAHERILHACQEEELYCHVRPRDFAFFELPADMETYKRTLSRNTQQQMRSEMKRLLGRNGIAVRRCKTTDQLPRFLEALFELHHRRWKQRGQEGTFRRKPDEARFYRQFTPVALEKGWLRLFGLEDNGVFKAIQIGYVYDAVFHQMQEGYDPDYVSGVGNFLRAKVIEACIADRVKAYDFLGEMTAHKKRWLAKERTGYDLFIGHRSLKNRILFCKQIWPTGRFLHPSKPSVGKDPGMT